MNTTTLTKALRDMDTTALVWKFALYSTRRGRDGLELDWYLCQMRDIADLTEKTREFLLLKPVADKPVAPYSPVLSDRENIAALAEGDELVREQIGDIILNIRKGQVYAPEDYVAGALPKISGYAFYGEKERPGGAPEQALFMRRGNPFLSGASARLCISDHEEIVTCDKPLLKIPPAADFLLLGGVCYFLSSAIQKDFSLEDRNFAIAGERLALIADAGVAGDHEKLEQVVMTAKNARKFIDFDKQILDYIARLSILDREEFLSAYGLTIDQSGRLDTSDAEQCELFIDLLCCRSCIDPLGRLAVGTNITPRQ
ncbi:MAG: hypothetical protein LBL37_06385 [Gracilibacteraceae bacterium]|nr:hypothetical protein [Gracilibacteraceae bacterium]